MTENHFRSHFQPFQINKHLFFTKWPPADILDDRKSFSIAFFAISDQYATFFFKMATSGPADHDFSQNGYGPPSVVGQWLHQI